MMDDTDIVSIIQSGFAGTLSDGQIVDRRRYPEATPLKENHQMKIPKPKPLSTNQDRIAQKLPLNQSQEKLLYLFKRSGPKEDLVLEISSETLVQITYISRDRFEITMGDVPLVFHANKEKVINLINAYIIRDFVLYNGELKKS